MKLGSDDKRFKSSGQAGHWIAKHLGPVYDCAAELLQVSRKNLSIPDLTCILGVSGGRLQGALTHEHEHRIRCLFLCKLQPAEGGTAELWAGLTSHTAAERRNTPNLVLLSTLVPWGTNYFLAEVNRSYDHARYKSRLILGADEKFCSVVGLQMRQTDGHGQVHSKPWWGKSSQCFSWPTGVSEVCDSGKGSNFHKQNNPRPRGHPTELEVKVEAQTIQFLPDTPCSPIFLSKFALLILKLDYRKSVFLAIMFAGNCLHSGCSSIVSIDSHCVYIHVLHLIRFSSLLFLFTGPFFILPGMWSIWERTWKAKVFQHPLIEICFIN